MTEIGIDIGGLFSALALVVVVVFGVTMGLVALASWWAGRDA